MSDTLREILERVARGEVTPEQAASELERLSEPPAAEPAPSEPVARVRLVGAFRTATITGDPSVREAVVDGPHVVSRDGETMVIRGDPVADDGGGFTFSRSDRPRVVLGLGSRPTPLAVRMNPDLPLDVQLAAGTLAIQDVKGPIKADVSAGACKIDGTEGPLDISVAAGSLQASARLASGASRIRCEAGLVKVQLAKGSSVKIVARAGLGKISLPGASRSFSLGGPPAEAVVGAGDASLDIETSMGVVQVGAEE